MTGESMKGETEDEFSRDLSSPSPGLVDETLDHPARFAGMIQNRPDVLDHLAAGYQSVREGFSEFLTSNDRGGERVKETADKLIDSIDNELARGGLNPEQRYRLIQAEERVLGQVRGNEKDIRQANERSFAKVVAIGTSVAVGLVVLGYLVKEGKLPLLNPPTA
ncbi:hypothetical protein HP499_05110 [Paenarthrobacter sp. CM16]|uniref:hypothetical protein n=1 Tax=Paenarthrobacter sp. CM16 TaxID=2738447 RepID=UPI001551DBA4|nr:hypothetical protein [Paenarthrobacter sp. CM16]NQD87186.1 hypothetical protein [Paenarthrobacter sp. CM16]